MITYRKQYREHNILQESIKWFVDIVFVVCLAYMAATFFFDRVTVIGHSMENVLENGDKVLIDKASYEVSEPKRFDVVVFERDNEKYYIKRIIGLPGETVQIYDGVIYINNTPLDDPYGYEDYIIDPGLAEEPIELGENEYFVLGDNRNVSRDSRDKTVFKVNRNDIIGRAWIRLFPLNKFGFVRHR